jgi:dTDP-4-amino-4,6-dideoxygalactose transaminase
MDALLDIAHDNKVSLVDDAAHALGATYKSIPCGSFGVTGNFSFYPSKIVTSSEGGMVTTDNDEVARRVKGLRNHGREAFGPAEVTELGYNFRLSEVHAALGISQVRHLDDFISRRSSSASAYQKMLDDIPDLKPQLVRPQNKSTFYAYIVALGAKAQISRDLLVEELAKRGIQTSIMYKPAHSQPFFAAMGISASLPVAELLGRATIALPMYTDLDADDITHVCSILANLLCQPTSL